MESLWLIKNKGFITEIRHFVICELLEKRLRWVLYRKLIQASHMGSQEGKLDVK